VITDKGKHQRTASEVDCEEYLAALAPFYRVHLNNGYIRIDGDEFQKVLIGTAYMALLIDTYRLLLFTDSVPYFSRKIDVPDGENPGIDVVINRLFVKHDVIGILDAYVMNGLTLLHERSNDIIYTFNLLLGYSKALTAFTADFLVFLLGKLGIIKVPLKLAAMPFCTAVAHIWRLEDSMAMLFLEVRAELIAVFITGATVLAEPFAARLTDIVFVRAGLAVKTGIKRSLFYNLNVTFDFLGYRRGIFSEDQTYRLK
jgi:hypothetical protein